MQFIYFGAKWTTKIEILYGPVSYTTVNTAVTKTWATQTMKPIKWQNWNDRFPHVQIQPVNCPQLSVVFLFKGRSMAKWLEHRIWNL